MGSSSNEGIFFQSMVLADRYTHTILHNKKKLIMIFLFPLALALVIVWVAGKGMFETFEQTQACLFMMVSSTIFVGLCNTIQEVCKERNIVKREYMANLNLASYILSKLMVQGAVSVISTAIAMGVYAVAFDFPKEADFDAIESYLMRIDACDGAVRAFKALWKAYQRQFKGAIHA